MKRVVLAVGLAASVAAPAAAQWTGMPVWNSPKGGTGITISGDWGRPDSAAGKGNAFGARAALGIGTVTLTAGVASYKPEGSSSQTAAVGGQVDFRVIGGSLLPIAVNAQLGAGPPRAGWPSPPPAGSPAPVGGRRADAGVGRSGRGGLWRRRCQARCPGWQVCSAGHRDCPWSVRRGGRFRPPPGPCAVRRRPAA